jgi:hypothetical protein
MNGMTGVRRSRPDLSCFASLHSVPQRLSRLFMIISNRVKSWLHALLDIVGWSDQVASSTSFLTSYPRPQQRTGAFDGLQTTTWNPRVKTHVMHRGTNVASVVREYGSSPVPSLHVPGKWDLGPAAVNDLED